MLRVDEEWLRKRQQRLSEVAPKPKVDRRLQGAMSRAKGIRFEELIQDACELYLIAGRADIQKTPEPMRPVQNLGGGKFVAYFEKAAQPDYKGILAGGRAIMFEAKSTDTDRIEQSRVSGEQAERLTACEQLGGVAFVLCRFGGGQVYRVPWVDWTQMKAIWGRKYLTEADLARYACPATVNGTPLFLEGLEQIGVLT